MSKHRAFFIIMAVMLSQQLPAEIIKTFKNNADLAVELSNTNHNRLMIQGDKIIKAAFPDGALTYQYDETDGSMYVHPEVSIPFTLFLSTKKGSHLSLTINSVASLGRTVTFKPYLQKNTRKTTKVVKKEAPFKRRALDMLTSMEQGIELPGVKVRHVHLSAGHFNNGLRLIKRETWATGDYQGESFDVYNNSNKSIKLKPSWFSGEAVKAVKLSKLILIPKEKAHLYRIKGGAHG